MNAEDLTGTIRRVVNHYLPAETADFRLREDRGEDAGDHVLHDLRALAAWTGDAGPGDAPSREDVYYVGDNVTGKAASREFDTEDSASAVCRSLNTPPGAGGRYKVMVTGEAPRVIIIAGLRQTGSRGPCKTPEWEVTDTCGRSYRISPDAPAAWDAGSPGMETGARVKVTVTPAGQIRAMKPAGGQ